jgi:hypothetical protein
MESYKCNVETETIADLTYRLKDNEHSFVFTFSQEADKFDFILKVEGTFQSYKTTLTFQELRRFSLFKLFESIDQLPEVLHTCIQNKQIVLTLKDRDYQVTLFNLFFGKLVNAEILIKEEVIDGSVIQKQLMDTVVQLKKEVKSNAKEMEDKQLKIDELTKELSEMKSLVTDLKDYIMEIKGDIGRLTGYVPSKILKSTEYGLMKEWIGSDFKLKLLYSTYNDGDNAVIFHSKCDGRYPTLTLIESEHDMRFGGYTKLAWTNCSKGSYKSGDGSDFIFTLSDKKKFLNNDTSKTIYTQQSNLPTFGGGYDIYISNGCLLNNSSYSHFPNSYGKGETTSSVHLAGSQYFRVKVLEVFQVILTKLV